LSEGQVAACDGKPDGADCSFGGAPGACTNGACEPLVCGDGVRSFAEACDGADLGDADCTTAGFYNPDGLACTSFCTFDVSGCSGSCGDHVINGDELCDGAAPAGTCVDLGFDAGSLSCAASCGLSFASCGRFGWTPESSGVAVVSGFAASAANDMWIVGMDAGLAPTIAHYDGSQWTRSAPPTTDRLDAVWAIAPNDVWIACEGAGAAATRPLHWNGTQWSVDSTAPVAVYRDVWAASASAVYFATETGVQSYNGASWQAVGSLVDAIVAIRGASVNDVWAAKADGTLLHWTGTAWMPVAVEVSVQHLDVRTASSVWVVGPSTTSSGAAIAHWNGTSWTTYPMPAVSPDGFASVLAIADNNVWVTGPIGQARHFDGTYWIESDSKVTTDTSSNIVAMRVFDDLVVGAAYNGFVHRYRGQMLARIDTLNANPQQSLWAANPNAVFVGDLRGGINRYNGETWTRTLVDATQGSLSTLWGSGPSDVWASGSGGRIYHLTGAGWSLATTAGGAITAIWGTGPSDVWFFGATGVLHYDGMTFTPATTPASGYVAASGSGANEIWAIAFDSTTTTNVVHYNGSWTATLMPHDIRAIVALAPNDVFATADINHILHYDGTTWTDTVVPVATLLDRITASAHDDVFATSGTEAVHFNGKEWTPVRLPMESTLISVRAVQAAAGYVDFLFGGGGAQSVRRLLRTRFWNCRATETGCSDGVDDDCDGVVDALDPDC
jgi:hypothetical protein